MNDIDTAAQINALLPDAANSYPLDSPEQAHVLVTRLASALRAATAERDRLCMETYRQTVRAEEAEAERDAALARHADTHDVFGALRAALDLCDVADTRLGVVQSDALRRVIADALSTDAIRARLVEWAQR